MKCNRCIRRIEGSHLVSANVNRVNFCRNRPHKGHELIGVNALIDEALTKSPHIVSAQVQVLENKFYVIRTTTLLVNLVEAIQYDELGMTELGRERLPS
jgi:hypothetical protein